MNRIVNTAVVGVTVLLLAGCGNNNHASSVKSNIIKTPLKLTNVRESEASTDKQGKFTLHIQTEKGAKTTVSLENSVGDNIGKPYTFKLDSKGQGQVKITLQKNWDTKVYRVTSKINSKKATSKDFVLDNKSTARSEYVRELKEKKEAKRISSSIEESKEDKEFSEEDSNTSTETSSTESSSSSVKYKKVGLERFVMNPDKYESTNIQTTGTVTYIQQIPDEDGMDFVVIVPAESYTGHGIASQYGTVAQIETDIIKNKGIGKGSTITVYGSGLTDAVKLKGHTLSSSIIVDKVSN